MDTLDFIEQDQFEELIQGLITNDYGCCNDFLLPATLVGLRENMNLLGALGEMKPAGIGNKLNFQQSKLIRSDKINWLEDDSDNEFESTFLKKVWRFIEYMNKTCFTSLKTFESHYSSYCQGSIYKRHIDQFKSEKGRKYSMVLYLNQNWKKEDGGLLSLYPINKNQIDISPLEGRLVFFRSDEMEHEVHSSMTRERKSIAGWMKN